MICRKFGSILALACLAAAAPPARAELFLRVSPTFQTSIVNSGPDPVDFDFYSIRSAAGLLSPADWKSLADAQLGGFVEAGAATPQQLAEASLTGSLVLAVSQSVSLGVPLGAAGQALPSLGGDAIFEYAPLGGSLGQGSIVFVPEPGAAALATLFLMGVAVKRRVPGPKTPTR